MVTHCMSEAFILNIFWMSRENCRMNWLQNILLKITCFLSCLIYSLQDEANFSVLQSVFATNSRCINCTDISCSQVTAQSVCLCAFGRRWERNPPENQQFIEHKDGVLILYQHRNKAVLWLVPNGADLCGSWWSWTRARGMQGPCDLDVKSMWLHASRGVCVMQGVSSLRFKGCPCDTWCHTSSWLHIGCVKNCRKSTKMAKVHRALPCSPDTSTLGLSYRWTKPLQTNRRGGWGGISIVHSGCFGILLLTEPRQKDLEKPACLKCVCMVNHSRPPALVSFTYFISQVCEPLHS